MERREGPPPPGFVDENRVFAYRYQSQNDSLLFPLWRRLACEPLARVVPASWSPNLLTLLATLSAFLSFLFLVGAFGSVQGMAASSSLVFLLPALGIFLYVTLDNTDGLQARRLGMSSPLGDFLDHWLDGFPCYMIPLGAAVAYGASDAWRIPLVMAGIWAFWATMWNKRKTGTLKLQPFSDIEGNAAAIGAHLVTAAFGLGIWQLPIGSVKLVDVMLSISLLALATVPLDALRSHRAERWHLLGVTSSMALVAIWYWMAIGRGVALEDSILAPTLIGLIGVKHGGDLLRNQLIGTTYRPFDVAFLACGAGLVASLFMGPAITRTEVQLGLMGTYFLFVCAVLVRQFRHTTRFVCRRLEIRLLTLTPAQKAALRSAP